jgi:hypothetical protein
MAWISLVSLPAPHTISDRCKLPLMMLEFTNIVLLYRYTLNTQELSIAFLNSKLPDVSNVAVACGIFLLSGKSEAGNEGISVRRLVGTVDCGFLGVADTGDTSAQNTTRNEERETYDEGVDWRSNA